MKIPPFWASATDGNVSGVGWSFVSAEDAKRRAEERLAVVAAKFLAGDLPRHGDLYYGDRPVREPIMRELRDVDGNLTGLVTRNLYGALVLNAARALFVDVDHPVPPTKPAAPGGFLARLFAAGPREAVVTDGSPERDAMARSEEWVRRHPDWQWRVYRTKAGLRFLATHAPFAPDDPIVEEVFDAMGADPLYRKLCRAQECFRARLTPKPWRCDYTAATVRWPFVSDRAEKRHNRWEAGYLDQCQQWATCELLTSTGSEPVHPELAELVTFHDQATRITSGLPLA